MKMLTKTTNCALERKRGGAGAQYFFRFLPPLLRQTGAPSPLSNSFRRHCLGTTSGKSGVDTPTPLHPVATTLETGQYMSIVLSIVVQRSGFADLFTK